jgi:glycosyltransferase involved in cell wall biosynthesis
MNVLWFSIAIDANNPRQGFNLRWIRAMAEQVESIHIIAMTVGEYDLPYNVHVHSVGKEKGFGEPRRAVRFYRLLMKILRDQEIDICFSHMIPLFSVMATPVLRLAGIPLITWYAHPSITTTLKLAHLASDRMVTSVGSAYPYKHDKLVVVGQGIDIDLFAPDTIEREATPPVLLCAGRLSASKGHATLIRAAGQLKAQRTNPFKVVIIGSPGLPQEIEYERRLHQQVEGDGLQDTVEFHRSVSQDQLVQWYRSCTVHVNLTPTGFGDKVAWESMACGKVCIAANEGFRDTLGKYADTLLFPHGDHGRLADLITYILDMPKQQRDLVGIYLREQVIEKHSLKRLMGKLVELFGTEMKGG